MAAMRTARDALRVYAAIDALPEASSRRGEGSGRDTPDSIRFAPSTPRPSFEFALGTAESAFVSDGSYLLYQAMPVIHQSQHFVSGDSRRVTVGLTS